MTQDNNKPVRKVLTPKDIAEIDEQMKQVEKEAHARYGKWLKSQDNNGIREVS